MKTIKLKYHNDIGTRRLEINFIDKKVITLVELGSDGCDESDRDIVFTINHFNASTSIKNVNNYKAIYIDTSMIDPINPSNMFPHRFIFVKNGLDIIDNNRYIVIKDINEDMGRSYEYKTSLYPITTSEYNILMNILGHFNMEKDDDGLDLMAK